MTEYTLGLALEDFLPVIFSSIGLFLVSRMVMRVNGRLGQMATLGWLLVSIGGFLKATWKLVMALSNAQTDLVWLDKGMFLWMATGFTLLAVALWHFDEARRGSATPQRIWLAPAIVLGLMLVAILATGFPDITISTWRFILLGIMTIGNVVLIILLVQQARRHRLNLAAVLLIVNIVIVFMLSGMARMPDQTVSLQWIEQILNTGAQGAFAFAAWTLYKTQTQAAVTDGRLAYD